MIALLMLLGVSWLASVAPGLVEPAAAQAGPRWEFGEYQQFTPSGPDAPEVATRSIAPSLRLSRVAVQRPQVAPGQTVKLIAEYQALAPDATISVKETRVIRFEGQQVATLERTVTVQRGKGGSSVALKVPADAAPGFYTVTTTVEPRAAVETRAGEPASEGRASSVFRVGPAAPTSPAPAPAPPAAPAKPPATAAAPPSPSSPPTAPAGPPAEFELWTDQTSHKIGEKLKVSFRSNRDGYATLVNVGTSGKITILYPNAYTPDHAVKAGQTYSIPRPEDFYELSFGGPEGVELVYALFTTGPARFVEDNFVRSRAFVPVNDRAEALTRDINLTVKTIPLKEQATAALEIEVTR
jgi:Domain of unknown function (DUF4384)